MKNIFKISMSLSLIFLLIFGTSVFSYAVPEEQPTQNNVQEVAPVTQETPATTLEQSTKAEQSGLENMVEVPPIEIKPTQETTTEPTTAYTGGNASDNPNNINNMLKNVCFADIHVDIGDLTLTLINTETKEKVTTTLYQADGDGYFGMLAVNPGKYTAQLSTVKKSKWKIETTEDIITVNDAAEQINVGIEKVTNKDKTLGGFLKNNAFIFTLFVIACVSYVIYTKKQKID